MDGALTLGLIYLLGSAPRDVDAAAFGTRQTGLRFTEAVSVVERVEDSASSPPCSASLSPRACCAPAAAMQNDL